MIDNHNLILLSGGYNHCDPRWTKPAGGIDQCYKVYLPIAGRAVVETDEGPVTIEPGRVYFISGYRLRRQECDASLDVYWMHFVPESLYLRYLLDQLPAIQSWSRTVAGWPADTFEEVCRIFELPFDADNRPRPDSAPSLTCRMQALLLTVIARLLETLKEDSLKDFHPEYYRLKPALDYMQQHFCKNPSLEAVAAAVHLAPNYFHRRFTALFGTTPFNYMMTQRLDRARHLLSSTSLTVKEVAEAVGYDNPLYFSRVFTARMHLSPSQYRATVPWLKGKRLNSYCSK